MQKDHIKTPMVQPFAALRVNPSFANNVVAPPYDVITIDEARQLAQENPYSFLRISRAELELEKGIDPYSKEVYRRASVNFKSFIDGQVLIQDVSPAYYVVEMKMRETSVLGLAAAISVDCYDRGIIRKHEFTRDNKQKDRVNHLRAVGAHTGPVMLTYADIPDIDDIINKVTSKGMLNNCVDSFGVTHTLWKVTNSVDIARISDCVNSLSCIYIADGHHRTAAASELAREKRKCNKNTNYNQCFLGVLIPTSQMRILSYNRVVRDMFGHSRNELIELISNRFHVTREQLPVTPGASGEFGMYLGDGHWYRLVCRSESIDYRDVVNSLDTSILSRLILSPILGINDLRTDERVDFVGGVRGNQELVRLVDQGVMSCAFSLYPTNIDQLLAIAERNQIMPPKSTWFEPKLADGLLSLIID